jgi:carbon monoxide dehydrogenase subunit G
MELEASRVLPAPREAVWTALNDPETLRRCIPGCESLDRGEDGTLSARMTAKVGPVSAKFAGTVALHDLVPPESYRLAFQGQGGAAGFAKGEAWVRLEAMPDGGTTMHYRSKASVGGKLAQVGARLVDASARKLADDFFERFAKEVSPATGAAGPAGAVPPSQPAPLPAQAAGSAMPAGAATPATSATSAATAGRSRTAWIVAAIVAAALVAWWLA